MDVSRIFAQHFPKLGPDLTDGTPYTTNLQVFLRPWVGSMNLTKFLSSSLKVVPRPSEAFLVSFWTDEKPYKCIGSK